MGFTVDKQTLDDLNLLGKFKPDSIFNVFYHTSTREGGHLLEEMFRHPLADADAINKRSAVFAYFQTKELDFPFAKERFEEVEHYLENTVHPVRPVAFFNSSLRKFLQLIAADQEYERLCSALFQSIEFFNVLNDFYSSLAQQDTHSAYEESIREVCGLLQDKQLNWILQVRGLKQGNWLKLAKYDYRLRHVCRNKIKRLLNIIYHLDVYISVAAEAKKRGFGRAVARPFAEGKNGIDLTDVFHPCLPHGIPNSIRVDHQQNVVFLTGANMAGKSTFMKSFSTALYLAHIGFPVAAKKMEFSVLDGMYTSINVPDNISKGYSHFYAEVLRVKQVAEEVASGKNLLILFDELFKGTNVKDAYDATVAVTAAFSRHRNCSYIISTHITEAGHTLKEHHGNFKFVFLPTVMNGPAPTYTYKLQEGITHDRHGMMIIQNEHILDIIKGNHTPQD